MVECNNQSKLICKLLENKDKFVCTVLYIGKDALIVNKTPCYRGIKELIRIIDSHRVMKKICNEKFKENPENADIQVRKQFHSATRSAIKCMVGHNHYGKRHQELNMNLPSDNCLRYRKIEI